MFIAFYTLPLGVLASKTKDQKKFVWLGIVYIFAYSLVWFFIATHQLKFFFGPMLIASIIFAITLDHVYGWLGKVIPKKIIFFTVALVGVIGVYVIVTAKNNYFLEVKKTELNYILGRYDEQEFYNHKKLGSAYRVSRFINTNYRNTTFLNIWSTPSFFVKEGNVLVDPQQLYYSTDFITVAELVKFITEQHIQYIIIDQNERVQSFNEPVRVTNPTYVGYREALIKLEQLAPLVSGRIYEQDGVAIYKVKEY
jgi:hypothetical protein